MLPAEGLIDLLEPPDLPPPEIKDEDTELIEALVKEMPTTMLVTLGKVDLTLTDFARLAEGDLLVLDQRVGEPLTARVAGEEKFLVWPGAVGRRQAVKVHSGPVKPTPASPT